MSLFIPLKCDDDLKQIIKAAFDANLNIEGSWGYTKETATIILSSDIPLPQFEHMFASMRAYIEMNMTLEKENRYGSINLNEISREKITIDNLIYDKVNYEASAMNEIVYASFINEYKEGYGKDDFDITEHFRKRKEATLKREVIHWFEISSI